MDDNDLRKQIQKAEELSKLLNNTGKEPLQSNEEWFDGLSIEEKAKVLSQFEMLIKLKGNHSCIGCIYDCKIKCIPDIIKNWEEWLKSPHEENHKCIINLKL